MSVMAVRVDMDSVEQYKWDWSSITYCVQGAHIRYNVTTEEREEQVTIFWKIEGRCERGCHGGSPESIDLPAVLQTILEKEYKKQTVPH